jgi:predicted nucleic acid-binding protein
MTRVLVDTSAYSAMRRGDERLRTPIALASEVVLTPVIVGELLYGFKQGEREAENRRLLDEFIETPRVRVVSLDEETGEHYALILIALRRQGSPIPTNDIWIAASAAQHGLRLLTLDEHFTRVPQLMVDYLEPLPARPRRRVSRQ